MIQANFNIAALGVEVHHLLINGYSFRDLNDNWWYPYEVSRLTLEERAEALLAYMPLEENAEPIFHYLERNEKRGKPSGEGHLLDDISESGNTLNQSADYCSGRASLRQPHASQNTLDTRHYY